MENLIAAAGTAFQAHHYRSATGDEVGLVLVRGGRPVVAVEVKRSTSPTLSAGTRRAVRDLGVESAYLVHPDSGAAYDSGGVTVIGVGDLVRRLRSI